MVVAAIVEKKRLQVVIDSGLLDIPIAMVPMLGAIAYWYFAKSYRHITRELGSRMSQGLYLRIFTAISTIGSMLLCLRGRRFCQVFVADQLLVVPTPPSVSSAP
ncbi:hypothetical protein IFM89_022391 [Coptis chinensis]|uniref:Uncharacterized protein n=1 Tax=Coptis chinensis TaxID=261450 RepID=A0A835MIX2_9MAGN|nr:hypothetical protein IFM89_022391 [Coptis chinensis]